MCYVIQTLFHFFYERGKKIFVKLRYCLKTSNKNKFMMSTLEIILQGNFEGSNLAATTNGIAIIVDVLRASTTIPTAMVKGITTFYVCKEVQETYEIAKIYDTLLMGERDCLKLPKYDFGNSPIEIYQQKLLTKNSASFTSSTGARRIIEAIGSNAIIIGSIINARSVVKTILNLVNDSSKVIIVPAFSTGPLNKAELTEDQIGGVLIAKEFVSEGISIPKTVKAEIDFLEKELEKTPLSYILEKTIHGQKLVGLNFTSDIEFCSKQNFIEKAPISRNDIITLTSGSKVVKFT